MEKKELDKKQFKETIEDLDKYCKKLNAMMYASSDGPAPQVFKMLLQKNLVDKWVKEFKKRHHNNQFEKAQVLVDEYINKFSGIDTVDTDEKDDM